MMSRKRVHSADSGSSPPKRLEMQKYALFDLPQVVLYQILNQLYIPDLGKLGISSKKSLSFILSWIENGSASISTIFPSMMTSDADRSPVRYVVRGSDKLHGFDPTLLKENFHQVENIYIVPTRTIAHLEL